MSESSSINHNTTQFNNMQYVKLVFHVRGKMWEKNPHLFINKFHLFPNILKTKEICSISLK